MLPYFSLSIPSEEPSLLTELWMFLKENYLSAHVYENLGLGSSSLPVLPIVLVGLFFGIVIATFFSVIEKKHNGAFVRKLLSVGAIDEENAKTLSELGLLTNLRVRRGVRKGLTVRKAVKCREEEAYLRSMAEQGREDFPPYDVDPDVDAFYIPEEQRIFAEMKFRKEGSSWGTFALVTLLSFVLLIVLLIAVPEILGLMNELAGALAA